MWYKIFKHFWRFLSRDILENQNKMAAKVELEIYIRKPRRAVIREEKALGTKSADLSVCLVFSIQANRDLYRINLQPETDH